MQEGENTSSVTVNSEVVPPKRRKPRVDVIRLVGLLLMIAAAVGTCVAAWFGGSMRERSLWEPKYDEQQQEYTGLQQLNRDLYTENTRLSKDYHTLEASNNALTKGISVITCNEVAQCRITIDRCIER